MYAIRSYYARVRDQPARRRQTEFLRRAIDMLVFEGRWNHYDDIVVDEVYADA